MGWKKEEGEEVVVVRTYECLSVFCPFLTKRHRPTEMEIAEESWPLSSSSFPHPLLRFPLLGWGKEEEEEDGVFEVPRSGCCSKEGEVGWGVEEK